MIRVSGQGGSPISVNVTVPASNGGIEVANNQAKYWSDKSKAWAISDELVDNTDYSSKYYANQAKESYEDLADDIEDLTTSSVNTIETAKNNAIDEINETKTQIIVGSSDIPLAYGAWSELPMGENWLKVDSDGKTVLKTDYPKLWVLLKNILDGSLNCSDIGVCTTEQYQEWEESITEDNIAEITYQLAHYYVLDEENGTIQLPKLIDESRLIGAKKVPVIADANSYGGCYIIYNNGDYEEFQFIARLEAATKTVSGQTVNYHKVTQWNDPTEVYTLTTDTSNGYTKKILSAIGQFSYEMVSTKYRVFIDYALLDDSEEDVGLNNVTKQGMYPGFCVCVNDTEKYNFCIRAYDGEYTYTNDKNGNKLPGCIPTGYDESYLISHIYGKVLVPDIEDYNGEYRLYIKVA